MLRLIVALLVGLVLPSAAYADWDIKAMNNQIDQTNFVVNQDCSGTLIDVRAGLILTANHCVAELYKDIERDIVTDKGEVIKKTFRVLIPGTVSQQFYTGAHATRQMSYTYKTIATDTARDLALLKTDAELPNTME